MLFQDFLNLPVKGRSPAESGKHGTSNLDMTDAPVGFTEEGFSEDSNFMPPLDKGRTHVRSVDFGSAATGIVIFSENCNLHQDSP
jgi:hypothetical protein